MGLSGAIRPVAQEQARLKEAAKLGFSSAVSPAPRVDKGKSGKMERLPLATSSIGHITDLVAGIAARRRKAS
jgi:DNA repair protein RadA/Sms